MRSRKNSRIKWLVLPILILLPAMAFGGIPTVNHVMVTDVTTVSFCVVWAASEASTASLEVFEDIDGNIPVTAVITPHPVESGVNTIKTAAEDNGVMKVRVTGLQAGTIYYFRIQTTSKSTDDPTVYPAVPPLLSVQTELETVRTYTSGSSILPFGNDIIIKDCYLEDGTTYAVGTLLIATARGASHPLSAFVGDGVDPPKALIDMNNFFSRESSENIDLKSGENLTLVNFRGTSGYSIITQEVPQDDSMCEVKPPAFALKYGRNMCSIQLEPNDPDITKVFEPIFDELISIWAYSSLDERWIFFVKDGLPFLNELNELHSFTGVWLYVSGDASFTVNGSFNPNPINLKAGRNLVGFNSIESIPVLESMTNIMDEFISIWTFDRNKNKWIFYVKDGLPFLNELKYVEPGRAYWVYVQNDCQWEY